MTLVHVSKAENNSKGTAVITLELAFTYVNDPRDIDTRWKCFEK